MSKRNSADLLERKVDELGNKLKYCIRCKEWKTEDRFYKDKSRPDGLLIYCKVCKAEEEKLEQYRKIIIKRTKKN